jgi:hypothetical protein
MDDRERSGAPISGAFGSGAPLVLLKDWPRVITPTAVVLHEAVCGGKQSDYWPLTVAGYWGNSLKTAEYSAVSAETRSPLLVRNSGT